MKRIPIVTFLLAAMVEAAAPFATLLTYDRMSMAGGEWWRFITGHLVHWSPAHLLWDLAAFLILGAICELHTSRWLYAATIVATAAAVSAFLFFMCPDVALYRGLSAIDSGLFLLAAVIVGQRNPSIAFVLLSAFVGKLIIEVTSGVPLFVPAADDVRVLPSVHLIGAAIGFCAAVAQHKIAIRCRASTSPATRSPSMTAA